MCTHGYIVTIGLQRKLLCPIGQFGGASRIARLNSAGGT